MSINASLVKGAVGLVSLSALSGGVGALYASTVTAESKGPELTIEEAIENNRNKSKEILDALEKELGERFKWNEDYWNVLVERMKEVVPKELHLRVVNSFLPLLPQFSFSSPYELFYLMEGKWKVGDSDFQNFSKEVKKRISGLSPLISKEKFKEHLQTLGRDFLKDRPSDDQIISLVNKNYSKAKKSFNLYRKHYSILYGVNFPEWSDCIWDFIVSSLFFGEGKTSDLSVRSYLNFQAILFKGSSEVDFCIRGLSDICIQKLKEHFGSTSEVGMRSDSSVPVWSSMNSSLTLEQAISKNRDKLEKIFNALEKKLGEGFKWEKNKEYWDVLVEKMREIVPEELSLYVVDHLWLLLPGVTSLGPLEKLVRFLMNETWKIEDSNFQSFVEGKVGIALKLSGVSPISKDDFKERLKVSESFSKLPSDKKISLINDKYLRVKEVFEIYKKELWGEGSLSWSDNAWNSVVLLLFLDRRMEGGEIFSIYMGTLLNFQSDEINERFKNWWD